MPEPFLETTRLVLRDKREDDLDFTAELFADPQVMRWIGDGSTYARAEVEARFFRVLAVENAPGHERWNAFKILERRSDRARIGQAGLLRCEIDGIPGIEIGWWLAAWAWGFGYATEAALALRDFAFRELHLDELNVVLYAENLKSVAVARRIGAEYRGPARYLDRAVIRYVVGATTLPRGESQERQC